MSQVIFLKNILGRERDPNLFEKLCTSPKMLFKKYKFSFKYNFFLRRLIILQNIDSGDLEII